MSEQFVDVGNTLPGIILSLSYLPLEWLLGVGHTMHALVGQSEPRRPAEPIETALSPLQHHLGFCLCRNEVTQNSKTRTSNNSDMSYKFTKVFPLVVFIMTCAPTPSPNVGCVDDRMLKSVTNQHSTPLCFHQQLCCCQGFSVIMSS